MKILVFFCVYCIFSVLPKDPKRRFSCLSRQNFEDHRTKWFIVVGRPTQFVLKTGRLR